MTDVIAILKKRVADKLFTGHPDIFESGERYVKAAANTGGVGFACFVSSVEQDRAFNDAFRGEALAAAPYIYALERALIEALSKRTIP